jgi:uncharacterized protein (TIGR03083 family)
MNRTAYIDSLRADAAELLTAAADNLAAEVPACPGWTVERLVGHVGRVYRWTAGWVTRGAARDDIPRPPTADAVFGWAREGLDELLAALAETADDHARPGATVATWAGTQPAIFWPRRMAVETALHRFDAQAASGEGHPVGTDLALDGVDELLATLLPARLPRALGGAGETLHLHATDVHDRPAGTGEWLVTLGPEGPTVEHAHAKGDVAVRGTASDLLLLLWNRVPVDRCEVFGDAGLLDRWREAVTL